MQILRTRAPIWFNVVAVLLVLWGLAGCVACYSQFRYGAEALGPSTEYDRRLFAQLPGWYLPLYAVAVGSGLIGAIALLIRSRWAVPLFGLSLVAVVVQFGWTFLATDLIESKGAATTVPFPLLIVAIAGFQLWLSRYARPRGWIR